jgi:hypothetical protein
MEGPPGFELRALAVEVGAERGYDPVEWADALVVVSRGEIELELVGGDSCRFGRGSVLCLAGLPLRLMRSCGVESALLLAASRRGRLEERPRLRGSP